MELKFFYICIVFLNLCFLRAEGQACKATIDLGILRIGENDTTHGTCFIAGICCANTDFEIMEFRVVITSPSGGGDPVSLLNEGFIFSHIIAATILKAGRGSTFQINCIKARNKKTKKIFFLRPRTFNL